MPIVDSENHYSGGGGGGGGQVHSSGVDKTYCRGLGEPHFQGASSVDKTYCSGLGEPHFRGQIHSTYTVQNNWTVYVVD